MTHRPTRSLPRRAKLARGLSLLALGVTTLAPLPAHAQDEPTPSTLPVRRVVLSTSGLAQFDHRGSVEGNGRVALGVRLDQVDDVLKSLVVFDPKGRLGGISLPGREPLAQSFRDMSFQPDDLANPVALLNALRGAEVAITGSVSAEGRVLGVTEEQVALPDRQGTVTRHRVSLMTEDGVVQALVEETRAIQPKDEALRAQMERGLTAIAANRARDRRDVTISLEGQGQRDVALSYVVAAPLWKSAYRLVLPEAGDKALLQGWAIVENMTGGDWDGVELTLVSGNPVALKQQLYSSYYADRPEIPVEVLGRILPRVDTGSVGNAERVFAETASANMQQFMAPSARGVLAGAPAPMAAKAARAMAADELADPIAPMLDMDHAQIASAAPAAPVALQAAVSAEATAQVLYRFPGAISAKAGASLMVPFSTREYPVERVWLYQSETNARHPLAAVRLTNDGDSGLPPGILTLFEQGGAVGGTTYTGDAQLPVLPKGENRLVTFALDNDTLIDRQQRAEQQVTGATLENGVLRIKRITRQTIKFSIKAAAGQRPAERTVLLEEPRRGDFTIAEPDAKEVEVTPTHYRVKAVAKAGETVVRNFVLQREEWQTLRILDANPDTVLAALTSTQTLNPKFKEAFDAAATVKREVAELEARDRRLEEERERHEKDQARVRQNLQYTNQAADMQRQYLAQMQKIDQRIAAIDEERRQIRTTIQDRRAELVRRLSQMKL